MSTALVTILLILFILGKLVFIWIASHILIAFADLSIKDQKEAREAREREEKSEK